MSDQIGQWVRAARQGDQHALAQLLSRLEKEGPSLLSLSPELVQPSHFAFRIGLTGPPGAGKSTLVGYLIQELRRRHLRVGVLAVDPSSPFTHGAILGDRIRYAEQSLDQGVFIRSLGTRGSLGGLSASSYLMLRAFDAVGFDVVLIETVGVGQTELEVMYVADEVVVVLVPESGDSVQAMKAGLLEIAHIFVVNKSDRPGASSLKRELEFMAETTPRHQTPPQVLETVATKGLGVAELTESLLRTRNQGSFVQKRNSPERLRQEAKSLLRHQLEKDITFQVGQIHSLQDFVHFFKK